MDIEIEEDNVRSMPNTAGEKSLGKARDSDFKFDSRGDNSFSMTDDLIGPADNRASAPTTKSGSRTTSINQSEIETEDPESAQYDQQRADSVYSVISEAGANKFRTFQVNSRNTRKAKCLCLSRTVETFIGNKITTSKYNALNFLPLNLFLQFSKFANLYFLVLTAMECVPIISDSNGVPVLALPLGFVVGLSMIKDIYEDYIRHQSDKEENNRKVKVGTIAAPGSLIPQAAQEQFVTKKWKEIEVG
jgi:magnesium-transporting ATPase (P-type)